jgi:hypothetical protein
VSSWKVGEPGIWDGLLSSSRSKSGTDRSVLKVGDGQNGLVGAVLKNVAKGSERDSGRSTVVLLLWLDVVLMMKRV